MNTAMMNAGNTSELFMSSREIAELTGKRHDHVKRDIRTMFEALDLSPNFGEKIETTGGRPLTAFKLNRYYTELLVTGYDVKRRAAVIDRWMELEKQVAQPQVPQSFAEALRLAADTQEQLEKSETEKLEAQQRVGSYQQVVGQHEQTIARISASLNCTACSLELPSLRFLAPGLCLMVPVLAGQS